MIFKPPTKHLLKNFTFSMPKHTSQFQSELENKWLIIKNLDPELQHSIWLSGECYLNCTIWKLFPSYHPKNYVVEVCVGDLGFPPQNTKMNHFDWVSYNLNSKFIFDHKILILRVGWPSLIQENSTTLCYECIIHSPNFSYSIYIFTSIHESIYLLILIVIPM